MSLLTGTVKNGQVILDEPADLPEGTRVEVVPLDASRPVNDFLEDVYGLAARGDLQGATDTIFDRVDRLLLEGAFTVCNAILLRADVSRLPTALMRSFLTITADAKEKLPARAAFYDRVMSETIRLKGSEKAQRLLEPLA